MNIVILTLDTFGEKMAGPAIRVWEMAGVLSAEHDVRILTFAQADRTPTGFSLAKTKVETFEADLGTPDIVIAQGFLLHTFGWLAERDFHLVIDLYDPFHLESLGVEKHRAMADREYSLSHALRELSLQVRGGDFFLCASQAQRNLWLGHLASAGRINPHTYDADSSLRNLIDLAPFGIAKESPSHDRQVVKGVIPGIGEDDKVIIWGGGIYNWFDPLTVIRAVAIAKDEIPNLRLLFMGAKHPNPDVPEMAMAVSARELVAELGLGEHVIFNEDWVDYSERHNYLLEADLGISAHFDDIETRFSFRTRILDYLWTGLPIITTEGDFFADLVTERGLGAAIAATDEEGMARAIIELLDEGKRAEVSARVSAVAEEFRWEVTLSALADYCRAPYKAADKGISTFLASDAAPPKPTVRGLVAKTRDSIRQQGLRHTASHVVRYAKQRLGR